MFLKETFMFVMFLGVTYNQAIKLLKGTMEVMLDEELVERTS